MRERTVIPGTGCWHLSPWHCELSVQEGTGPVSLSRQVGLWSLPLAETLGHSRLPGQQWCLLFSVLFLMTQWEMCLSLDYEGHQSKSGS